MINIIQPIEFHITSSIQEVSRKNEGYNNFSNWSNVSLEASGERKGKMEKCSQANLN